MYLWPAIVFGWPSAFAGLVLLVLGIALRRAWLVGVGALVSAGFCAYLAMNPLPFRLLGLLAIAGNVLAVLAVHRRRLLLSCLALLPFLFVSCYLIYRMRVS